MSEQPTEGQTQTQTAPPAPETGPEKQTEEIRDEAAYNKALAKANKEAATLRKQLEEFQNRDLTELEKSKKQLEELLAENSQLKLESLRVATGIKYELPADAVELLYGATEDELETNAKKLAGMLGVVKQQQRRQPDPSQGQGSEQTVNDDPLYQAMLGKIGIAKG